MLARRAFPLVFCLAALGGAACAEDAFYSVPLADLQLTEGKFPDPPEYRYDWRTRQRHEAMRPRAVLDGEGEVYVDWKENRAWWWWWSPPTPLRDEGTLAVRAPAGRQATGSLYVPLADYSRMARLRFAIDASAALKDGDAFYEAKENAFYLAKENHYEALLDRDLPGGAWYRHQVRLARIARGDDPERWSRGSGMRGRGVRGMGMGGMGMGGMQRR